MYNGCSFVMYFDKTEVCCLTFSLEIFVVSYSMESLVTGYDLPKGHNVHQIKDRQRLFGTD